MIENDLPRKSRSMKRANRRLRLGLEVGF